MLKPLFICLSAVLLLPNLVDRDIQPSATYNGKERFSPQLSFINSLDKLEKFVDKAAKDKNIQPGTFAYIHLLETTISYRFFSGCSYQTLQQDWISALSDRIAGTGYSRLQSAEKILQYPQASSMQQNIVFNELLKRKNLASRMISVNDQATVEVYTNGNWYYFDVAGEAGLTEEQRLTAANKTATAALHPSPNPELMSAQELGGFLHPNGKIGSQNLTMILSKILWLFPLAMIPFARRRTFKLYALKPRGKYVRMQPGRPVFNA